MGFRGAYKRDSGAGGMPSSAVLHPQCADGVTEAPGAEPAPNPGHADLTRDLKSNDAHPVALLPLSLFLPQNV